MLNITKVIEYTAEEENHVNNVLIPQIKSGKDPWDDQKTATKKIKKRIASFLETEQNKRCVYCEMALARQGKHIEHFVARHIINEFAFEPQNLFLSCPSCNSRAVKDDTGIIVEPGNKLVYEKNTFLVVHPYFHNPDDHIAYIDEKRVIFDYTKCTDLGRNTIKVFKWDNQDAITDRAEAYVSRKHSAEVQDLVNAAILYPTLNHLHRP